MTKSNFAPVTVALQTSRQTIERHAEQLVTKLDEFISQGNVSEAHVVLESMVRMRHCIRTLDNAHESLSGNPGFPVYIVGAWFLSECRDLLTKTADEAMLFVTGVQCGMVRTLDRFLQLKYQEQSTVFVAANDPSVRSALSLLKTNEQKLLAWFHSHPGKGISSTHPSDVDLCHQRDLEQGGYPVIGGIFTRDGYVRFFGHETDFQIEVLGSNVEQIDERVFKLKSH